MRFATGALLTLAVGHLSACSGTPAPPVPAGGTGGGWWKPAPGMTWQWQLATPPTAPFLSVGMYDVDLFETSADTVAALKATGVHVVCYLSAGTYEPGRPDSAQFPDGSAAFGGVNVLGSDVAGWPGERWLDVRNPALAPIMRARLDLCAAKGFDGVEPDNVDGYANANGWGLTAADQLTYDAWLAAEAHRRGLSVGLKNDLDQVKALVGDFDWALDEQCFEQSECDLLAPFLAAGKAVFEVEYALAPGAFCYTPAVGACARGFSAMQKHLGLDAWRDPCVCP